MYHRHILSHSLARKVNGKVSHSNWVDKVVYEGVCTFHDILKLLQEPVEIRTIPVQGNLYSKERSAMYSCAFLILKFLKMLKKKEDNLSFLISIRGTMDMK